jgi:hypothetical protein
VVVLAIWEGVASVFFYLALVPFLAFAVSPIFLLLYVAEIPAIMVPLMAQALAKRDIRRILGSLPAFMLLRFVNSWFFLEALWSELIVSRTLTVFNKGH